MLQPRMTPNRRDLFGQLNKNYFFILFVFFILLIQGKN